MIFSPPLPPGTSLMQKTVTYIQGSCFSSQMQNIFPRLREGGQKSGERKEEGDDIKDRLIFCAIYWLVLSLPSHYIMSEIVNKQITTAHQRARRGSSTPSFSGGLSGKKTFVFTVHFNNISHFYLCRQKKERKKKSYIRIYMNHCLRTG